MVTTKKFGRVTAMLLALVMLLTLVPFQSFAASVPANELVLKDGVTVALSSDMTEDQINKALFNALVENADSYNYQDYSWEYECEGKWALNKNRAWGSIFGFTSQAKVLGVTQTFTHPALTSQNDEDWQIRLAGTEKQVTVYKVSSCTVNYNYELTQGSVLVNNQQVSGTVTGVSPKNEIQFTVDAKEGYKVASVTVNGDAVGNFCRRRHIL